MNMLIDVKLRNIHMISISYISTEHNLLASLWGKIICITISFLQLPELKSRSKTMKDRDLWTEKTPKEHSRPCSSFHWKDNYLAIFLPISSFFTNVLDIVGLCILFCLIVLLLALLAKLQPLMDPTICFLLAHTSEKSHNDKDHKFTMTTSKWALDKAFRKSTAFLWLFYFPF